MSEPGLRWGITGPGEIARVFAESLAASNAGRVVRVHGRSAERGAAFCTEHGGRFASTLDELVEDPDVEAVYVASPHVHHAEATTKALRAGRAVLCEKPMTVSADTTRALWDQSVALQTVLLEAWMYRCHPQIQRLLDVVDSGEIGEPRTIRSWFGFEAPVDPTSRLFALDQGGGAILDVGGYPVSIALLVAGDLSPEIVGAQGELAATGAVADTDLRLRFANGMTAELQVAITRDTGRGVIVEGEHGSVSLDDPFVPGGERHGRTGLLRVRTSTQRVESIDSPHDCYALEALELARMVRARNPQPRRPMVDRSQSIAIASLLQQWRTRVGAREVADVVTGSR